MAPRDLEPRSSESQEKTSLPTARKVCYALGGAPYQLTGNAIGFFLQIFLLDVVQLEPFHASSILFLGRAWDAVSDPTVGFLVSKSPRRKCGKLIPWMLASTPFAVTLYCLLWFMPGDSLSVSVRFFWYLVTYCLFQTCLSRRAYMMAALVLGSLYSLSCLVLVLGVKEQPGPLSTLAGSKLPFLLSLRHVLHHRPYVLLLSGFFFISLAFQMVQGIFAFFCTHAAGLAGSFQYLVIIMLIVASLSIPLWQWFLVKFGKKTAVLLGFSIMIPTLIILVQVKSNFLVFALTMIPVGCSASVVFLLPWSMLPDTVDDFQLKNPDCLNLEAFFYSFYIFFNKFGGGLSLGISTMSLHFAKYHPAECRPNPAVLLTLKMLLAPVPIGLILIGLTIFCFYPINEERRKEIKVRMEEATDLLCQQP
ncbi:sodium-dependent lysophosphatidylcholine symporter 1-B-like isoform X3 [Tupaia chinensis]|uniref:sodium-dependent lysophosphatidylcholine symporter 1-B-like isoform X3 n=1 Tax=Tupaia chinensis TaxID=246437 RepID=UPI000FFB5230|nr:sodium-dependent lysophosphatidylcholine symporter 1-B-like isoform X3 [Tupaia chinensis]